MSPDSRPVATRLPPGSGTLPETLEPAILASTNPILLLVAPDAGDPSVRTAIQLAEARAREGGSTILADASVAEPRLHELLDVENLEGLADVFLFGASLERVRTRPDTWSFDFVPMGAYVPDPSAVLESSRWASISATLREDGERLFLFVPAGSPGLGILSRRVGEAVLIGDAESVERAVGKLDPSCEILAVVEPLSSMAPDRLVGEAGAAAEGEASTIFDDPELTEPVVFRGGRKVQRAISPVLLILLVAALLAAGWFVYQEYFAPAPQEEAVETPVAPAPVERGEPVETPIPISVAVEAHQDLESAWARVRALEEAEPDLHFFLAPVGVRDVIYYRLLAGPVSDQEAGEWLMGRLVERNHKTASDPWAIRPTEQAFLLGEFDDRQRAEARVDSLARLEIPTYIVPIRYDPGPPRYRVYGGAYESEAEAIVMRDMLLEAGLDARLVARTGEPMAEGS